MRNLNVFFYNRNKKLKDRTSNIKINKRFYKTIIKRISGTAMALALIVTMSACSNQSGTNNSGNNSAGVDSSKANSTGTGLLSAVKDDKEVFTERDLNQTADTSDAKKLSLESGKDITISDEGVYILSGDVTDVTVNVEADDKKVQLVLDGVSITNSDSPCIYVKSADKVFVTTTDSKNALAVTGEFQADGDTNTDSVIFSKDDLVVNGTGTLDITSTDNAVASKDKLKITGSTLSITCTGNAFEAHEGIYIADGTINVTGCNDGIHAKDSDDDSIGEVYISGGTITITAGDDAIHATTVVVIDGGKMDLNAGEGIEATYITVNDGEINITASDDGINAASKSSKYTPTFELNGGKVVIEMGRGDTDGVDANGNIYINGGTIDISGQSTFDYDGTAEYNGGTIIENGTETNTITNQDFGGMGPGMQGGDGNNMRPGMQDGDENNFGPGMQDGDENNFGPRGNGRMRPQDGNMQPPDGMQQPEGDMQLPGDDSQASDSGVV